MMFCTHYVKMVADSDNSNCCQLQATATVVVISDLCIDLVFIFVGYPPKVIVLS